jgi:RNA polymerase sigma-70 factor (ECF subfamily)
MSEVDAANDARMVDALRRGDEEAFVALYARHQPPIYRYALQMCGAAAADDVVQETFAALLRDRRFDPGRGSLAAYLFGIARHHILRVLSVARLESPLDAEGAQEPVDNARYPDPFEDMSRTEAVESVRAAIQTLPAVYREAIALCELQDLDYATAAAIMECPVGTVRSRLHRARALLGEKLAGLSRRKERSA